MAGAWRPPRTHRLGTIMNALNSTLAAAAGTGGLQAWIKDNVIPLLLLPAPRAG